MAFQSMLLNEHVEVAIVGAGPVGLMAAYRLGLQGVRCIVFEREETLPEDLRASTFHPATLDLLEIYGLDKPLMDEGLICPSWQIRIHETGERAIFDLSVLAEDTRHPFRLQAEQFRLSRLLAARLAKTPSVELRMGVEVVDIAQDDDGVTLDWRDAQTEARTRALYVIGADGARSVVRQLLGFAFEGQTYPETTILATTTFPFEERFEGLSNVNYVWTASGTFSLLRLPSVWRCSLYPEAGESIEDAVQPESIERKLQHIAPNPAGYEKLQWRPYRIHMRIVDDYRQGRVLLAGDAAHINSPSGGMGMNGGLHDAFSLTDELIDVLRAGADPVQLDRYTRRRRPIAMEEVLSQADANRGRMQERDPAKRREILSNLQRTLSDPAAARAYMLKSSMIAGLRRAAMID